MKDYVSITEYANRMSMSRITVWRKFKKGEIEGIQDPVTGTIRLKNIFDNFTETNNKNRVALYARVSSSENKDNLDKQLERLRLFAIAKGYTIVSEIKEIGSGLNDNRPKLLKLLTSNNYGIILVEHKDRLTRFGFNYLDVLLRKDNKKIEVINLVESDKEELVQDFVSIITSFCARIYGQRKSKRKAEKLIENLKNE